MRIELFKNDIPSEFLENIESVAVDTEAMGLCPHRDRLCLCQLSKGDGNAILVQFENYEYSHNLKQLLGNPKITKIFHYARFDVMMLKKYLNVTTKNIFCTKIASKLARTYTSKHSLLDLCKELLNIEISKEQTCTDWGNQILTEEQKAYAATDVLYLHDLKKKLESMLIRENRLNLAHSCFNFIETRIVFDLLVGESYDIFAHH